MGRPVTETRNDVTVKYVSTRTLPYMTAAKMDPRSDIPCKNTVPAYGHQARSSAGREGGSVPRSRELIYTTRGGHISPDMHDGFIRKEIEHRTLDTFTNIERSTLSQIKKLRINFKV